MKTSPVPNTSQYVCGDDCSGECSGEVDGTPHCPKSPVPTSGTGTAPEGASVEKIRPGPLAKECIGRYDECASDDGCECITYCLMAANNARTYPGMAKDIGNLTLRVDAMEKTFCECPATMEQRISELETALKTLQEEVKCLVEGAPPKDSENYYKIDLGYPLKLIYIRKQP